MTKFTFVWNPVPNGVEVKGVILDGGSKQSAPLSNWSSDTKQKSISALSKLEALCEDGDMGIKRLADGYFISHHNLAALSEHQALSLNLPVNIPLELRLTLSGPLINEKTKTLVAWHNSSGTKIRGQEAGAIFFDGITHYRIPDPIYSLITCADAFNEWNGQFLDDRLSLVSNLKDALELCSGEKISSDNGLGTMRFSHAAAVSLDLKISKSGVDFDPVIFSQDIIDSNTDSGEGIKESQALLSPELQSVFAQQFRSQSSPRPTYVLERGHYVYIDPTIRQAIACIKKYQNESPEVRARFVKSPQSFIRDELIAGGVPEDAVDQIVSTSFVETDGFSSRVLEIGLWQPPVLPFVKRNPKTWVPEGYGLKVGSKSYVIKETDIHALAQSVAQAIKDQQSGVKIGDDVDELPATNDSLQALNALIEHVLKLPPVELDSNVQINKPNPVEKIKPPLTRSQKSILRVQDNFQSESFVAQFSPRYTYKGLEIPRGLKTSLKDHQNEGVSWMQEAWSLGYPGVLLADDMGLGKTFQALSFLCWLKEKSKSKNKQPILVVAPISLLGNWEKEAVIHLNADALGSMALLYGSNIKDYKINSGTRSDVVEGSATLDISQLKGYDWILTNYNTMRDYHISLASIDFQCIVFDEMQNIKNPQAMMTNAAQSLNSEFQIGLTGTPIENSLADIWTIFDTLMPGFLGLGDLRRFLGHYTTENPDNLRELKTRLSSSKAGHPAPMLRRMKHEVAKDLPKKTEKIIDEQMPSLQAGSYHEVITSAKSGHAGKSKLEMIHQMRSISLHPNYGKFETEDSGDAFIGDSARLKVMLEILESIHAKSEKVLIFIESLSMQQWLAYFLKEHFNLPEYPLRIYGNTSADKRTKIVAQFQSVENKGFDILLLSPKAAGVGLTLTAAANVIHLTRWWNPAVEDQCTDRVYRIGQDKEVTVFIPRAIHPLYGNESFDCLLHEILENKRALSREMLVPMESAGDIDYIFGKSTG